MKSLIASLLAEEVTSPHLLVHFVDLWIIEFIKFYWMQYGWLPLILNFELRNWRQFLFTDIFSALVFDRRGWWSTGVSVIHFYHVSVGTLRSSPQPRIGCIKLTAVTLEKEGAEVEVERESQQTLTQAWHLWKGRWKEGLRKESLRMQHSSETMWALLIWSPQATVRRDPQQEEMP